MKVFNKYILDDYGKDEEWKEIVENNKDEILNKISTYLLPENSVDQQFNAIKILCEFSLYQDTFYNNLYDLISNDINIWECSEAFIDEALCLDDNSEYIKWFCLFIKKYIQANHDLNNLPKDNTIKCFYNLLCNVDNTSAELLMNALGYIQKYYVDENPMLSLLTSNLEYTVIGELLLHYINDNRYPYSDIELSEDLLLWINSILSQNTTAEIFYSNDINVCIDMILSELRNLPNNHSVYYYNYSLLNYI